MIRKFLRACRALLLLTISLPVFAQYATTPHPSSPPSPAPGTHVDELVVAAKNGQTQEQQWSDRYECHNWARGQSGFDPTRQSPSMSPPEVASGRAQYRRAFTACMEGRGYSVQYGPPPAAAPAPPPPAAPMQARHDYYATGELRYHPLDFHIDGGYTVATGSTDNYLDDGANVGFGVTWFPTSLLPVGFRVDGSYSSFHARRPFLDQFGSDFTSGHENIYGGDADIQLDLAHGTRSKFYLFGGAGWYREQTQLREFSVEHGTVCGFFHCGPGTFGVVSFERHTTPWRSSWNSGLGWEIAYADHASFFVEARYLSIAPRSSKMQFVPIRVGLRF